MKALENAVQAGNEYFYQKIADASTGGLQKEQYIRYLQMQYHLTKGVQETFLHIASHSETRKYRKLRKFLINFAYEEEMHYRLAELDLAALGATPGEIPFVIELWWQYQKMVVDTKPIERLGATAILENIGNYAAPLIKGLLSSAPFIAKENTRFVEIHMHEALPHGDQIMDALQAEKWSDKHAAHLLEGAKRATWLYAATIFDWVLHGELRLAA